MCPLLTCRDKACISATSRETDRTVEKDGSDERAAWWGLYEHHNIPLQSSNLATMWFELGNSPTNVFSTEQIALTLSQFSSLLRWWEETLHSQINNPENTFRHNREVLLFEFLNYHTRATISVRSYYCEYAGQPYHTLTTAVFHQQDSQHASGDQKCSSVNQTNTHVAVNVSGLVQAAGFKLSRFHAHLQWSSQLYPPTWKVSSRLNSNKIKAAY